MSVRVLSEYAHVSMRIGIYAVFPSRKFLAPKAKVFVDFLCKKGVGLLKTALFYIDRC